MLASFNKTPKYEIVEAKMVISVKEVRRSLGSKKAKKYTDEQIEEVIRTATVLSDLMLDFFIERERKAKLARQEVDKKRTKD